MQNVLLQSHPFQLPFLRTTTYGARLWGRATSDGRVDVSINPRNFVHLGYIIWRDCNLEVVRRIDALGGSEEQLKKLLRIGVRIVSMLINGDEKRARDLLAHYEGEIYVTLRSKADAR